MRYMCIDDSGQRAATAHLLCHRFYGLGGWQRPADGDYGRGCIERLWHSSIISGKG